MKNLLSEVQEVLGGVAEVDLDLILSVAAEGFEKSVDELMSRELRRTSRELALMRAVVWAVAWDLTSLTCMELGRRFSRHYGTILKGKDRAMVEAPEIVSRLRALVIERVKEGEVES